jgi:amino acid permease
MQKNLPFRTWFYFRLGWSTYFAFLFAAINTLTVTYYLAIEKYPVLFEIFPTFGQYVLYIGIIGIPILIFIGYVHYKKSPAYKSEADVVIESNPHSKRMLLNSETMLGLTLELLNLITKISNNEKLSDVEKKSILKLQEDLTEHMTKRSMHPSKLPTIFDNN